MALLIGTGRVDFCSLSGDPGSGISAGLSDDYHRLGRGCQFWKLARNQNWSAKREIRLSRARISFYGAVPRLSGSNSVPCHIRFEVMEPVALQDNVVSYGYGHYKRKRGPQFYR